MKMIKKPDHAFILAAGRGERLKPYTDLLPKPLVEVDGKPLIEHALDHLKKADIKNVTVNLHYLADLLEMRLDKYSDFSITISKETKLLDTGGGIKNALNTMGDDPFYILSGDSLWTDGTKNPALERMADFWNPDKMDLLLLFQPVSSMSLTQGIGDYDLDANGCAVRSLDKKGTYMWTSIRICKPELFENTPDAPFSFLEILDKAEKSGRLYGLVHDADWHHISTPADLDRVNEAFTATKRVA